MSGKASVEAIEEMITLLKALKEAQDGVINRLNATYSSIGSEWADKHYQNLGEVISSISRNINNTNNEIEEATQRLQKIKGALQNYLDA